MSIRCFLLSQSDPPICIEVLCLQGSKFSTFLMHFFLVGGDGSSKEHKKRAAENKDPANVEIIAFSPERRWVKVPFNRIYSLLLVIRMGHKCVLESLKPVTCKPMGRAVQDSWAKVRLFFFFFLCALKVQVTGLGCHRRQWEEETRGKDVWFPGERSG